MGDLDSVLEQLKTRLPALLDEQRLTYGKIQVMGTPRRLVALVEDLSPHQPDLDQVVKGPPAERAYRRAWAADQSCRRLCAQQRAFGRRPSGA